MVVEAELYTKRQHTPNLYIKRIKVMTEVQNKAKEITRIHCWHHKTLMRNLKWLDGYILIIVCCCCNTNSF